MTKMEVHIISRETVKPSHPSTSHPKTYRLSQLDQLLNVAYAPITLFYPATEPNNTCIDVRQKLDLLRKSLSEALSCFYPLAGKLKDDLSIYCNDQGAYFVETQVNIQLNKLLGNKLSDLLFLYQFLPRDLGRVGEEQAESYVTNVQANVFECGGIAIGLCISHMIVDASALSIFLHGWASIARGTDKNLALHPKFIAGSLFPADDLWLGKMFLETVLSPSLRLGTCITKRFIFDISSISKLKAQATSSGVQYPSSVEVVSALLWKCMVGAASSDQISSSPRKRKPSLLTHLVNLRRRVVGEDWESSMGNLLWMAAGKYTDTTSNPKLEDMVEELRAATSKINDEFVRKMMATDGSLAMTKSINAVASGFAYLGYEGLKEVDCYWFSSWCKIGFYDVDFGWGKPVWITPFPLSGSVFPNSIFLVDTRHGNGIEAWVSLDEQQISALEEDPELLKYMSIDPNPLL